jgi:hypothetical protein
VTLLAFSFSVQKENTNAISSDLYERLEYNLRDLKTDVMQRMSLLSGTIANRPTPEIVNATWGGAGYGLIYISTDTHQLFQWNGGAWVDVTTSVGGGGTLNAQGNLPAFAGNGASQQIYGYTLLANTIGTLQGIRVKAGWLSNRIGANNQFSLNVNGAPIQIVSTPNSGQFAFEHTILRSGAGANDATFNGFFNDGNSFNQLWACTTSGFPLDWTVNQVVEVTFVGAATSNATPIQWIVERI